jgi:hypothetical protein
MEHTMKVYRVLALAPAILLFGACEMLLDTDGTLSFLEFEASMEFSPDSTALLPVLHVTNHSTDEVGLNAGGCSSGAAIAVYDEEGHRVWDRIGGLPDRFASDERFVCSAALLTVKVPPGATVTAGQAMRMAVDEILGDSLPEGRYRFTVRPDFQEIEGPEFPVGDFLLRK